MRKVLLFGTSGNPPTGPDGHSGIVEYFVSLSECFFIQLLQRSTPRIVKNMLSYAERQARTAHQH